MEIKYEWILNQSNTLICILDWDLLKPHIQQEHMLFKTFDILKLCFPDRLAMLTPWPAASIKQDGPAFQGEANQTIKQIKSLLHQAQPYQKIIFVGYSLSALCLLYQLFENPINTYADYALISPSTWYPSFMEFIQNQSKNLMYHGEILLLFGKQEGLHKPFPLAENAVYIHQLYEILSKKGRCVKKLFPKGHHDYIKDKLNLVFEWALVNQD